MPCLGNSSFSQAGGGLFKSFRNNPLPGPTIPYSATFPLCAGFRIPTDFQMARYPGLELVALVCEPSGTKKLVSYWTDESHYRVHVDSLQRDFSLPAPDAAGFLTNLHTRKEHFWKRYSWKEWIVGAAALFGAVSALHNNVADLFDPPNVQVAFVDSSPMDVNSKIAFSSQITILNDSAYASTRISGIAATAKCESDGKSIVFRPDVSTIPLVAAGQSAQLKINGALPGATPKPGPPDICSLEVAISAHTGFFRGTGLAKAAKQVRVWPTQLGWSKLTLVNDPM